jgi:hypothetical protein
MWVPLEATSENFIQTSGRWSSGPPFIGKIFSPSSNFSHPKENLSFPHRSLVVDISEAIRDYQEPGSLFDRKLNDMSLFQHPLTYRTVKA